MERAEQRIEEMEVRVSAIGSLIDLGVLDMTGYRAGDPLQLPAGGKATLAVEEALAALKRELRAGSCTACLLSFRAISPADGSRCEAYDVGWQAPKSGRLGRRQADRENRRSPGEKGPRSTVLLYSGPMRECIIH